VAIQLKELKVNLQDILSLHRVHDTDWTIFCGQMFLNKLLYDP